MVRKITFELEISTLIINFKLKIKHQTSTLSQQNTTLENNATTGSNWSAEAELRSLGQLGPGVVKTLGVSLSMDDSVECIRYSVNVPH